MTSPGIVDAEPKRSFVASRRAASARTEHIIGRAQGLIEAREGRKRARRSADAEWFARTTEALVCDLLHRLVEFQHDDEVDGWIVVRRGKRGGLSEAFPALLDVMAAAGLIEQRVGTSARSKDFRTPTLIRAGGRLIELANDTGGLDFADFRRDRRGEALLRISEGEIEPSRVAFALAAEIDALNRIFGSAQIELAPGLVPPAGRAAPDAGERFVYRKFKGSLERGGRLAGAFWLGMRSVDRRRFLRIGGEPIASLDYGQIGLRILYAHANASPPEGDLYAIPGLEMADRGSLKKFLSAMVSNSRPLRQWPADVEPFRTGMRAAQAAALVEAQHPAVAGFFGREAWGPVQRAEADIIIRSVLACSAAGWTALPVHDCLLVPASKADRTQQIMVQSFERETGGSGIPVTIAPPLSHPRRENRSGSLATAW